jgi:hypothetical protein
MASADEKPWAVDTSSRVYGLQMILLKRVYVLPWAQFLYAEGTSEEVQAFFSTHNVVVGYWGAAEQKTRLSTAKSAIFAFAQAIPRYRNCIRQSLNGISA